MIPRAALPMFVALAASACGYRPAHTARDPHGPFVVVAGRPLVAQPSAVAAAEAGARAELARAGQLADCTWGAEGCAGLELEIVRIEESAAGIALEPRPAPEPAAPLARALEITITGRATLRASKDAPPLRSTGDTSASEYFARDPSPGQAASARDEAARQAARRLGERLTRKLLGQPEP